jgi:glucose-6-phosphate isomerase
MTNELSPTFKLGAYQSIVNDALTKLEQNQIVTRIWQRDHTVWKPDPEEITNRLGWLYPLGLPSIAETMQEILAPIQSLVADVRAAGYTHVLHMGMGGSSLAPDVLSKIFKAREGYLTLSVLDSTDPEAVLTHDQHLQGISDTADHALARALFIVATKSGTTTETLSFFKYFYDRLMEEAGPSDQVGEHFVAITDPGSQLIDLAQRYHFRDAFANDPEIGGRYSVLSYFGMVPAALMGLDISRMLERAMLEAEACKTPANVAAQLGVVMGTLAQEGRDKLTLVISPAIADFGDWVEQLIAESTGKEGKGILPVVGELVGPPVVYGSDRLFVHLRLAGDETYDTALSKLEAAGHPVVHLPLNNRYDLGRQFFLWEFATAVAGHCLKINPFNQPNVESAKKRARQMMDAYQQRGELPARESAPVSADALHTFLRQAKAAKEGAPGDYIAIQAYVQPTPETDDVLEALQVQLRDRYRLATTVGYGPRYLHSTGQLHKGDAGNGIFIQFTADDAHDVRIPELEDHTATEENGTHPITFSVLKQAQALGDAQALEDAGRRLIHFHLGNDVINGLTTLMKP